MNVRQLVPVALLALARPVLAQDAPQAPDVHFVPTPMAVVEKMLEVTKVGRTDVVYDLGSGDGRIVITAASRRGARGVGIDIDPVRIEESRHNADSAGVKGRVTFRRADLFKTDLREATVVTLYLLPLLNRRLLPKLYRELEPGARIASNAFDMGDWKADSVIEVSGQAGGTHEVFYWLLPADASGHWTLAVEGGETYGLRLQQRYQQVEGSATVGGEEVPIEQARVKGDSLLFTLRGARFSGRVSEGTAQGRITDGGGESREWTATRRARGRGPIPPDTTGQS
jgi:hypothetical protein